MTEFRLTQISDTHLSRADRFASLDTRPFPLPAVYRADGSKNNLYVDIWRAWTLTLPASPSSGDAVEVMDGGGTFSTNNLTIARNSQTIMSLAEDLTVSTNNVRVMLVFNGTTWRLA